MQDYNRMAIFISLVTAIISIAGLYLAYRAIQTSWEIAEISGNLSKSELIVGLQGNPLPTNGVTKIIIGAAELTEKSSVVIGSIPYSFVSAGQKTLEDLNITFQYKKLFKRKVLENMAVSLSGDYGASEIKRQLTEANNVSFSSYRIDYLNPGVVASIAEPLFLEETEANIDTPVTTKDGVSGVISLKVNFSLLFGFTVNAKDIPIRSFPIEIAIEKATSMEELTKGRLAQVVESEQKKIRENLGFLKYLGSLIFSAPKSSIYLLFVPLQKFEEDGLIIWGPKSEHKTALAEFSLLKWRLLFPSSS
jgi:hypothetical protein